ncbi:glycosyl hydrolase [Nocardia sp. ET3-3]|uniref:Glycosyl hydrolase n=1 Tax=Nocardia terrae TaxID=2675851 RepID=A0A7K1URG7_9NOCA|nr:glycoside hydrolase family 3 C-terminal domain-containing protein [Nocardia terrae]MVU76945.1 glycosyl hydrolase [Nocardia terrae]
MTVSDTTTGYSAIVESALAALDLDDKAALLAGQDLWSLRALPKIGLRSLVMSDGPVGVRGGGWSADDPSLTLPSPTALAATWDPELARRAGQVLAAEAHRKGVHMLLAPTINLHRSPVGGRHFEAYSEDPLLTAAIGAGYVTGVQECGVAATIKHFVANDAETQRFTVNNEVSERALRELYLAPFEEIIATARPWALMSAYNGVNGVTMTENGALQVDLLRREWGYDGVVVSDWLAARDTVGAVVGGTDIAMPGPYTVFGAALALAVREGRVAEATVDDAVRRVLLLAARLGLLDGAEPAVAGAARPTPPDGIETARELAARSMVLLRNENRVLPLSDRVGSIALIGSAARDARVLGGGSATVFPARVVSPLDGLRAALPEGVVTYTVGADPNQGLELAGGGFDLRAILRDAEGWVLAEQPLTVARVRWTDNALPGGADYDAVASVEIVGTFTPRESGPHEFGLGGLGAFRLAVADRELFDGVHELPEHADPFEALTGPPTPHGSVMLTAGEPVPVSLLNTTPQGAIGPIRGISFTLAMREPRLDDDTLIEEAVAAAAVADIAVVVVATTTAQESEGFDRADLRLPGRQDELVTRVAAVNPRTVVVVNSGSPVEMPWRDEVSAILLSWFPGQEGGAALADVLLGRTEPGGRLPTTWPVRLADAPVREVTPEDGVLRYDEGIFIGYRAWQRHDIAPAYPFGHGLGYTDWHYESIETSDRTVRIRLRNTGSRPGREVVQIYLAPSEPDDRRPRNWLADFTVAAAEPGETTELTLTLPDRAFRIWDETSGAWQFVPGRYRVHAGRSNTDLRISAVTDIV